MGCNNEKSYSYISSEYDHENIIRQYEEETLKCFHKTFNSLMLKIASEEDFISVSKVEDRFLKEYSEDMLRFVQEKYKTDKGYKASIIKNLIYITCPDMPLKTAKSTLHDKLGFIISNVKSNLDESMSSPMNIEDIDLDKLIGEMFDIACVDIVDKAISVKGAIGESDKLRQYKESVIKKYKEDFFIVKGEKKNVLVYADMEEKLKENPFLFTTGDIRVCAWNILMKK